MSTVRGEHSAWVRLEDSIRLAKVDGAARGSAMEAFRLDLLKRAEGILGAAGRRDIAASDVVQETFVAADRYIQTFRGQSIGEWRGWLQRILFTRLAAAMRVTPPQAMPDPPPATPEPPIDDLTRATLRQAIERLPERHRQVVLMRVEDGLKYREIAGRIGGGATEESVRALWYRALERLERELPDFHESR